MKQYHSSVKGHIDVDSQEFTPVGSVYNNVSYVNHHCWVEKGKSKDASLCWSSLVLDFRRLNGERRNLTKRAIR